MNSTKMQPPDSRNEMIDRTLAALGRAVPNGDMEARVLHALAERSATNSAVRLRPLWFALPTGACVALAVLAIMLPSHRGRPELVAVDAPHRTPNAVPLTATAPPAPSPTAVQVTPRPRAAHALHVGHSLAAAAKSPATPTDEPLTQQERLLQQIARAGVPNQLAMLNPELRANAEAEDEAEFRRYFSSPHVQIP